MATCMNAYKKILTSVVNTEDIVMYLFNLYSSTVEGMGVESILQYNHDETDSLIISELWKINFTVHQFNTVHVWMWMYMYAL